MSEYATALTGVQFLNYCN